MALSEASHARITEMYRAETREAEIWRALLTVIGQARTGERHDWWAGCVSDDADIQRTDEMTKLIGQRLGTW
jgi:hypothetical protein